MVPDKRRNSLVLKNPAFPIIYGTEDNFLSVGDENNNKGSEIEHDPENDKRSSFKEL